MPLVVSTVCRKASAPWVKIVLLSSLVPFTMIVGVEFTPSAAAFSFVPSTNDWVVRLS